VSEFGSHAVAQILWFTIIWELIWVAHSSRKCGAFMSHPILDGKWQCNVTPLSGNVELATPLCCPIQHCYGCCQDSGCVLTRFSMFLHAFITFYGGLVAFPDGLQGSEYIPMLHGDLCSNHRRYRRGKCETLRKHCIQYDCLCKPNHFLKTDLHVHLRLQHQTNLVIITS
jgi:hypothetical protein